ncbi:MAG: PAS domain S-box protein [Deltaproteobacteria bacterium]|nr:PAS domain S-box protein [Deltaproteobacteria bacterium]
MNDKLTHKEMQSHCRKLEGEVFKLRESEKSALRQNKYLTALHETSVGLINRLDRKELLESVLNRAASLTGTEHGFIYLLEPGENEMEMRVGMGFFNSQLGRRVMLGEGLGGVIWKTEQPMVVNNYSLWNDRLPDSSLDTLHASIGIPLKSDPGVLGVIGLAHVDKEKQFNAEDIIVLQRFAEIALIALEKARLYSDVRRELAERKKTETILRQSEERYRLLLESSPDPVVVYDVEGNATYVNPAFEQTFGFSGKELLGRQIDFVPQENWPETKRAIENMLKGEKIQLFETKRFTKDGRLLDVQLSSTLYLSREGKLTGNIVTLRDISALKKAEKELQKYHDHLEVLVEERTEELAKINQRLIQEVDERKRAEETLLNREVEYKAQSQHLEEVNTALKVLLKQREDDKKELGESVLSNVKELIAPYVERLNKSKLDTNQNTLVNILESNLSNIISPFISKVSSKYFNFTPMEIRVANLVKDGKTNKEIADLLFLSKNTILFHRHNIRSKLGLKNRKINLRSHLLSYDR